MLYLKSLELKNFKKHSSLRVDFTQGLNVIVGPNFSGKTTLKQAVLFALWGPTAVPGGKEVIQSRAGGKTLVTLDLFSDTDEVRIERSLSTATLYRNGEPYARGSAEVTRAIDGLLEAPRKHIEDMRISDQGRTAALLSTSGTELKRMVERLAGVEVIDKVLNVAGDRLKVGRGRKEVLDRQVAEGAGEYAAAKEGLGLCEQEITRLQERSGNLTEEIGACQSTLDALLVRLREAEKQHRRYLEVSKEREVLQGQANALQEEQARCQDKVVEWEAEFGAEEALQRRAEEISKSLATDEDLRRRVKSASAALDRAEARHREAQAQLRDLQVPDISALDLAAASAKYEESDRELARATDAIAAKERALKSAVCQECRRPFDSQHAELLEEDLRQLRESLPEAQRARDEAMAHLKEQRGLDQRHRVAAAKLETLRAQVDAEKSAVLEAEQELEALPEPWSDETRRDQGDEKARLEQALQTLRSWKQELKSVARRLASLEARMGTLPEMVDIDPAPIDAQARSVTERLNQAQSDLRDAETRRRAELKTSQDLSEKLRRYEDLRQEAGEEVIKVDKLARLIKLIKDNREQFLSDTWEGLLAAASVFVSACTGGAISKVGKTPDFELFYEEDGREMPLDAASGAQQSILGLGLKRAIGMLQPNRAGFLLLDEATADMSPLISAMTEQALRDSYPQVISITHRELDQVLADQVIALS
jgi:DNA repair exonuclease SbcCD ATPase subunit